MHEIIERIDEAQATADCAQLVTLLQDVVHDGASVGFMRPLSAEVAEHFWRDVIREVGQGDRILLVARHQGRMVGSVQLGLCMRPNGLHRAEVQKLFVHTSARQRGLGRRLMSAIKEEARCRGRSLLYLDTEPGKPAEALYRKLGWTFAGEIPDYFYTPDGQLKATAFFFKRVGS